MNAAHWKKSFYDGCSRGCVCWVIWTECLRYSLDTENNQKSYVRGDGSLRVRFINDAILSNRKEEVHKIWMSLFPWEQSSRWSRSDSVEKERWIQEKESGCILPGIHGWRRSAQQLEYANSSIIAGNRTDGREQFLRLMRDSEKEKIDYIITNSTSRFARNTVDSLSWIRKGVGIYFEEQSLDFWRQKMKCWLDFLALWHSQRVKA